MKEGWLKGRKEIAAFIGIHEQTLKTWMKTFAMPITRIRGRLYSDQEMLKKWINYPHEKGNSKNIPKNSH